MLHSSCPRLSHNLRNLLFASSISASPPCRPTICYFRYTRRVNSFLNSSDHHLVICRSSESCRTVTLLKDIDLETIMYGCLVPIQYARPITSDTPHSLPLCPVSSYGKTRLGCGQKHCNPPARNWGGDQRPQSSAKVVVREAALHWESRWLT